MILLCVCFKRMFHLLFIKWNKIKKMKMHWRETCTRMKRSYIFSTAMDCQYHFTKQFLYCRTSPWIHFWFPYVYAFIATLWTVNSICYTCLNIPEFNLLTFFTGKLYFPNIMFGNDYFDGGFMIPVVDFDFLTRNLTCIFGLWIENI